MRVMKAKIFAKIQQLSLLFQHILMIFLMMTDQLLNFSAVLFSIYCSFFNSQSSDFLDLVKTEHTFKFPLIFIQQIHNLLTQKLSFGRLGHRTTFYSRPFLCWCTNVPKNCVRFAMLPADPFPTRPMPVAPRYVYPNPT